MDVLDLLEADHREMRGLIARLKDAPTADEQAPIASDLFRLLRAHSATEEEVVYPDLQSSVPGTAEIIAEGVEEHHVADVLMAEADACGDNDAWEAKVKVLCENVEHHAEEEEDELFPLVRSHLDATTRAELGERTERRKLEHLFAANTVDQLRKIASDNDVSGTSALDKRSLVEMLVEAGIEPSA